MASLPEPPVPAGIGDKVLHLVVFTALAGLIAAAYPRASLITLFIILALFGAAIEVVQTIPALGRSASFEDWIADIVASGITLLFIGIFRKLAHLAHY